MLLFYWNDKIALNLEQGYTVKVAFLLALSIHADTCSIHIYRDDGTKYVIIFYVHERFNKLCNVKNSAMLTEHNCRQQDITSL